MKKRIRPDNSTKVWRYIMKKGEVSKTDLQRAFSHRLTAGQLDEITYQLELADMIRIRNEPSRRYFWESYPYPGWQDKKRGRKWRTSYVEIVLNRSAEQKNLSRDKERELSLRRMILGRECQE